MNSDTIEHLLDSSSALDIARSRARLEPNTETVTDHLQQMLDSARMILAQFRDESESLVGLTTRRSRIEASEGSTWDHIEDLPALAKLDLRVQLKETSIGATKSGAAALGVRFEQGEWRGQPLLGRQADAVEGEHVKCIPEID